MLSLKPLPRPGRSFSIALRTAAIVLFAAATAGAQVTTFNYSGPITDVFTLGSPALADDFMVGDTVDLEVSYDISATPLPDGDPNNALVLGAMVSLSLDFPEGGALFTSSSGAANTISVNNDVAGPTFLQDTLGFGAQTAVGDTITGTLDGNPVIIISLTFNDLEFNPGVPAMLLDDSLPDQPVSADRAEIIMSSVAGQNVTLTVDVPEPLSVVSLAIGGLALGSAARGRLRQRHRASL